MSQNFTFTISNAYSYLQKHRTQNDDDLKLNIAAQIYTLEKQVAKKENKQALDIFDHVYHFCTLIKALHEIPTKITNSLSPRNRQAQKHNPNRFSFSFPKNLRRNRVSVFRGRANENKYFPVDCRRIGLAWRCDVSARLDAPKRRLGIDWTSGASVETVLPKSLFFRGDYFRVIENFFMYLPQIDFYSIIPCFDLMNSDYSTYWMFSF